MTGSHNSQDLVYIKMIRDLNLVWDPITQLIICRGRIHHLSDSTIENDLVLMSPKAVVTRLYVEHHHRELNHVGVNETLAALRHRVWIPKCRPLVKDIIRKCVR